MGLPMNDIHTPTVPSGPTTQIRSTHAPPGLSLMELIDRRDRVEEELKSLGGVLDSHGVNMNTSLTTFDGYPRDDIDVAQIRTTRARIIRLKNDYKELMSSIERGLHQHHASLQGSEQSKESSSQAMPGGPGGGGQMASRTTSDPPFALVNSVTPSSPAHEAGLMAGDKVRNFGPVHARNHANLQKVAEVVQRNEGRSLLVQVTRNHDADGPGGEDEAPSDAI